MGTKPFKLDLEFEELDESTKPQETIANVDDLEFNNPVAGAKDTLKRADKTNTSAANVVSLDKRKKIKNIDAKKIASNSHKIQPVREVNDPSLNISNVNEKVIIAETKGRIFGEYLADAKLLEYKIHQVLKKMCINKDPNTIKQAKIIQKLMAEFVKKTKY